MGISHADAANELTEAGTAEDAVPQEGGGEHPENTQQEGNSLEHFKAGRDEILKIKSGADGQQKNANDEDEIPVDEPRDDAADDDVFVHGKTSFLMLEIV